MKYVVIIPRFLCSSNMVCYGRSFFLRYVCQKERPRDNYEFLTNSAVSFAIISSSFVGIM